jgi:hypothetical protein
MENPETGEPIPTEPTLVFAAWDGQTWYITFPSDPGWTSLLASAPVEAIPGEGLDTWLGLESLPKTVRVPQAPIGGYLLPWAEGKTVYLSRSTAHDGSFPSGNAHYSFDFYISKTMYDLHAAKAGTVWLFKDSVPNNDHSDVNYLVLQDASTNPPVYQLYLHLAQNSIPAGLKAVGTPVAQGQFIGIADNTGQSTGHHLHFQVQKSPHWNGYWGESVDITFDDVDINGGRPRVLADFPYCDWPGDVCNTARTAYVSGNTPQQPPSLPRGDVTAPQTGVTIGAPALTLSGWAADDQGIASAQFRAYYAGEWRDIGPAFKTPTFSYTWDLCSDRVADGPVSVSLEIQDVAGNMAAGLPGLRHLVKQYDCGVPQPACQPAADQAALFSAVDFGGSCVLLGSGDHQGASDLGSLGAGNAASILVGSQAAATLYSDDNLSGRGETFTQNDSSLADNRIGAGSVASVRVRSRSQVPAAPRLIYPPNGEAGFTSDDTIGLTWDDGGGGLEFKVKIDGSEQPWQPGVVFHISQLSAGSHAWQVKSRNAAGESDWSPVFSMQIQAKALPGSPRSLPFSDDMEDGFNSWSHSSAWDQTNAQNHTGGGTVSWGYEPSGASAGYSTGAPNSGNLTSPPANIPSNGSAYLRFWYFFETEAENRHWDQRWVQISANNGPFQDVLQLTDDPVNAWLQSPVISLSGYAGKTIRVRFHFETLDAEQNAYKGWFIDDFSINNQAPQGCSGSGEPNNTPGAATMIAKNSSASGTICPGGDIDFFQFTANAGDQIGVYAQAQSISSQLDTYLFLLDSDGASVLASSDDIIPGVRTDSFASYRLARGGTYYLKLRAWNHPSVGGDTFNYILHLVSNTSRPGAAITAPPGGTFLPNSTAIITVIAADSANEAPDLPGGISHVDFYYHSGDWINSDWTFLGSDWDAAGDWTYSFDTSLYDDQRDIGFYAQAYDWAGNTAGTAIWQMALDRTAPSSAIKSARSGDSTAIKVEWTGSDNIAGIDHFDLQAQKDGGSWYDLLLDIDGAARQTWAVVERGHAYSFRLRAADRIGNTEAYPSSSEASAAVPSSICDLPDKYENDNTRSAATLTSGLVSTQEHNFCNPASGSGYLNDQDWVRINLKAGRQLIANAQPASGDAAAVLRLYAADGATLLQEVRPAQFGEITQLFWEATTDSTVYLQITHLDGRVAGDEVVYLLTMRQGFHINMPLIIR